MGRAGRGQRAHLDLPGAVGLATGASWLCYYAPCSWPGFAVAPIDKLSVVVAIALGVLLLGEPLSPKVLAGGR